MQDKLKENLLELKKLTKYEKLEASLTALKTSDNDSQISNFLRKCRSVIEQGGTWEERCDNIDSQVEKLEEMLSTLKSASALTRENSSAEEFKGYKKLLNAFFEGEQVVEPKDKSQILPTKQG